MMWRFIKILTNIEDIYFKNALFEQIVPTSIVICICQHVYNHRPPELCEWQVLLWSEKKITLTGNKAIVFRKNASLISICVNEE